MSKNEKMQEIIRLLEQIKSERMLFVIYGTVKAALAEQEAEEQGVIERVQEVYKYGTEERINCIN